MADDVLRIADGDFVFHISDPKVGSLNGPVLEIGPAGVLIATKQRFDTASYETVLDVTIELKGHLSRQFFASVSGNEEGGVRLTWLNIDPGQSSRLKVLLDAYKSRPHKQTDRLAAGEGGVHKTRRMIKPSAQAKPAGGGMVITPFGGADPTPMTNAALSDPDAGSGREKRPGSGTRRVVKPGAASAQQSVNVFPGADVPEFRDDDSKANLVLTPTGRHERGSESRPGPFIAAAEEADVAAAAESGKVVVGHDGRMDIGATLRSKAKTVRASELAARHDKVRVLNLATIKQLIMEAVEEAASHLSRALTEGDRKRLLEEAEESFQERMKAFQLEKDTADEKSKKLADQLNMAQKLLEDERKRTISSDQFTVSASGLGELEAGFQKLIDRAIAEGKVDGGLEEQLRKLAERVFDEERQRIREKEMHAQNDKIDLLEKKIKRLAGNLEETERQRDEAREIAQALESMGGLGLSMEQIKSKYKIGLAKDDPRREAKLAIMKELLEENRDLRRKLGITLNEVKPEERKPEPPRAAAPAAPEPEASDDAGTATNDLVNPDDEPWGADAAAAGSITNPDDLPWEAPAAAAGQAEDAEEGGVKIMRKFKNFEPPPLQRK